MGCVKLSEKRGVSSNQSMKSVSLDIARLGTMPRARLNSPSKPSSPSSETYLEGIQEQLRPHLLGLADSIRGVFQEGITYQEMHRCLVRLRDLARILEQTCQEAEVRLFMAPGIPKSDLSKLNLQEGPTGPVPPPAATKSESS